MMPLVDKPDCADYLESPGHMCDLAPRERIDGQAILLNCSAS
jgi:hypothetical protein